MKKLIISLIFLLGAIVVYVIMAYNSLVSKEEAVLSAWAQVESNYQRRNDLIPSLVRTVSHYLEHESKTLIGVVGERNKGLSALDQATKNLTIAQEESTQQLKAIGVNPPSENQILSKLTQAQRKVGLSMRQLLAVVESYPTLKSSDQFLRLQAQLEGSENRINVARMFFNDTAREYNASIRRLPYRLIAEVEGMQRKAYFTADEGADNAKPLNLD